jgi:SNF2 family DNA or RNA helicase
MKIIDGKALLLKLRSPKQVTAVIPKSRAIGANEVLVKWGVDEVFALRNMNIKVPSPIEGRYTWPGQYKPMAHQRVTASFLTLNKRAFCFNEQGTGKTASAIWAADFLMTQGKVHRVLIICPLSIMDSAWRNDLFSVAMHRTIGVAYGSAAKRRAVIAQKTEFVVINYDGVEVVAEDIAKGGFDLIIVDEATHYKNAQSKRWKVLNKLVTPDTWLWLMTGTPAAQSPVDSYGLAKLIDSTSVPRNFNVFKDTVMQRVSQYRWEPKETATDTVYRILQPAIRFLKSQCLDLPELSYIKRQVELTVQQKHYYTMLKKNLAMDIAATRVTAVNAAIAMSKLLQISAGAVYDEEGDAVHFDISNRYNVLKEVIDETSHKVLIFVPFKHAIELITAKLRKDGVDTEIIQGDVTASKRTDIINRFQTTKSPRVLVIQPQAAAHGVTLTAADTIVWWGPTSSLETYAQANARIHRSGQVNKCTIVQLVGSPVEARVYKLLDQKIDVHSKLIDLYTDLLD